MGGHRTAGAVTGAAWRARLAVVVALVALVGLAACGTQGYAASLGRPATVALGSASAQQPGGSAVFTPFYATHVVVYYKGTKVPYQGAATPVELRRGTCTGTLIAPLTAATVAPGGQSAVASDPSGGADVAVADSDSLFVVVRARANDPGAAYLACGQPLSGRRQFFDLHVPGEGSNGYTLGIALMEPIVATRVKVALARPATSALIWAVRSGSCVASPLAQGHIVAGATQAQGVVFSSLNAGQWRLTLTPTSGGQQSCQSLSAGGA